MDDTRNNRVNRGYRVQFSSALGPFQGGLRFDDNVGHGTIKFLAFETVFRNALVGEYGGAAGGSDFHPRGKSDAEVMRFCQSFMTELSHYIGPNVDVPSPGLGVGSKEIGYMFGQYKRLRRPLSEGSHGVISGGQFWYPQATGHGLVHFAEIALQARGLDLKGKRCVISGSGMTALAVAGKLMEKGAIVLSFSDSSGYIVEPAGFSLDQLQVLIELKTNRESRVGEYIMSSTSAQYFPASKEKVWNVPCDLAFPCSFQNDIDGKLNSRKCQYSNVNTFWHCRRNGKDNDEEWMQGSN